MSISNVYRVRARDYQELAKRARERSLKTQLNELARACSCLADAIERHPEVGLLLEPDEPILRR